MVLKDIYTSPREFEKAGITLAEFDRKQVIRATRESPVWVHFGAGNIFRAFPAVLQQKLLDLGLSGRGIIAVEGFDYELIDRAYLPYDSLSLSVTLCSDGTIRKSVTESVVSALKLDFSQTADFAELRRVFADPGLQMASFTITEKGYSLLGPRGELSAACARDMERGPFEAESYMGKVAALCYLRYKECGAPLAMVSMDNCSHNGDKLRAAVAAFAGGWVKNGKAEPGFADYVNTPGRLSFPWTMIDKITPRPDPEVRKMLEDAGFEDTQIIITEKHSYTAPFVNAEECEYLVVEDDFPNGRPPLEKAGVIFCDRDTVERAEKMKVCTCLNPLHTALAVFGCLLGYTRINEEMKDPDLLRLVEKIGYAEGLPVVTDPGIISPRAFIDEVIKRRLPNPFLPDTPQRIATDTSQKIPVRFGATISAYAAAGRARELVCIPLVLAAWLRYLLGTDDGGRRFDISPDPLSGRLCPAAAQAAEDPEKLRGLLSDAAVFGTDLCAAGLDGRVTDFFAELCAGPGAVRKTLKKALG